MPAAKGLGITGDWHMDLAKTRADFPLLQHAVYLDSSATSLCPEQVIAKTDEYYREYKANIHRGAHHLSQRATNEYGAVYEKLARFTGGRPENYFHTKNATEAINLVALGLDWKKDANIVTTTIEHHSNYLPWLRLAKRGSVKELRAVAPIDKQGLFSLDDFEKKIDSHTQLVAITACSNVLGNKPQVREITKIAHDAGALVLLDAAQLIGHAEADFKRLGVDFAAFSGHKMLAPSGTGVLYHAGDFASPVIGGGMITSVTLTDYSLMPAPQGEEAGTPNIAGVIGLGAAIDYISKIGFAQIEAHEMKLVKAMLDELANANADVYGPLDPSKKAGLVAFNIGKLPAHQVAVMADQLEKVCIRSGHHCAMPLHHSLGIKGSVRASVHLYNNEADVQAFGRAIKKISALA